MLTTALSIGIVMVFSLWVWRLKQDLLEQRRDADDGPCEATRDEAFSAAPLRSVADDRVSLSPRGMSGQRDSHGVKTFVISV